MSDERPAEDAAAGWGAHRHMNPLEAMMWRAEADPRLRSTILAIEILDQTPEWDRFLAAHDWASRMVPRFRRRCSSRCSASAPPTWSVDPHFDLHYHVRRMACPKAPAVRGLSLAEQFAMTAVRPVRSPWEAVLVEGLPDGKAAYMLKLHHSTTDGMGAVQLFASCTRASVRPARSKLQRPAAGCRRPRRRRGAVGAGEP